MEERCWICKRNRKEIEKDAVDLKIDGDLIGFYKKDNNAKICLVCKTLIDDIALDQSDVKFDERVSELKVVSNIELR